MQEWKNFDYANPPAEGVYWLVINSPEYDVDVDNDGRTTGASTGKINVDVCMAAVSVDGDGLVQFEAMDRWAFGQVADEDRVSHYCEVVKPAPPTAQQAETASRKEGDLPGLSMKTFSFRAECQDDVQQFHLECIKAGILTELRGTSRDELPDVDVELQAGATLRDLQEVMRRVGAGHVMLQTLRECALAQNSLERNYDQR